MKAPVAKFPKAEIAESTVSKSESVKERQWRAEDALRDIERAKQHESNRGLMRDVKKLASKKIKALGKIC